jgi:PrgI family protein
VSPREQSPTARVRIPADVEREGRLLANLTARQLALSGVGGIILWVAYDASRHVVPVAVFAAAAAPFAAVAVLLALGRVGGMPPIGWRGPRGASGDHPVVWCPHPRASPVFPSSFLGSCPGSSELQLLHCLRPCACPWWGSMTTD